MFEERGHRGVSLQAPPPSGDWEFLDRLKRCVLLKAGDDAALRLVELLPPSELTDCRKVNTFPEPLNTVIPIIDNGVAGIRVVQRARTDINPCSHGYYRDARVEDARRSPSFVAAPLRQDAALRLS